ncbi:MAG: universal stress protein [Anaerolineales bacterium]|nr:universal stress protein [Anaerolineales bacterium]
MSPSLDKLFALEDFRKARQEASLQEIMYLVTRRREELLSYEEVRRKLKGVEGSRQELKEIPLDAIVGSVSRCQDFTRSFLPRSSIERDRWVRVMGVATGLTGFPPIDVYQIGEVYFVQDGHHRVSVARRLGMDPIQAYVKEVHTKVTLTADIDPDDLIIKAEFADFLEHTRLDKLRPQVDLRTTVAGKYQIIMDQIDTYRYVLALERDQEISYQEAVVHWCDEIYMPVVEVIQERNILRDFPKRNEIDLFLWISDHHDELIEELGWDVSMESTAADLPVRFSPKPDRILSRFRDAIQDSVTPGQLESGPPVGKWRQEKLEGPQGRMFADILVAVAGTDPGWNALELGLKIAWHENAHVLGLHTMPSAQPDHEANVPYIQTSFDQRCEAAGIPGKLAIEIGHPADTIVHRARWADLVVAPLRCPPEDRLTSRLVSGFRTLVQRCPTPLLAVPGKASYLKNVVLAYDGSLIAQEALFMGAYLAGFWDLSLTVVTVMERGRTTPETLSSAQQYLETYGVQAEYVEATGSTAEVILKTAEAYQSCLLIVGIYGSNPFREVMLGSTVDHLLRSFQQPILICR